MDPRMQMDNDHIHHQHAGMHHEIDESNQSMSMMKMYFHFGLNDQVLFQRLILDSNFKLCLTCIILFIVAIFCEALKYLRGLRCRCELVKPFYSKLLSHDHHQSDDHNNRTGSNHERESGRLCCTGRNANGVVHCQLGLFRHQNRSYRLAQAFLHIICTTLSLTLMLVAMTYNVCLIFSIVLGKFLESINKYRERRIVWYLNSEDNAKFKQISKITSTFLEQIINHLTPIIHLLILPLPIPIPFTPLTPTTTTTTMRCSYAAK